MSIYPIVKRKLKTRKGKGFSRAELKDAKLNINEAYKYSIPIDLRRSTKHEENVKKLKTYIKKVEPKASTKEDKLKKPEPKKAKNVNSEAVKKVIKAVEDAHSKIK